MPDDHDLVIDNTTFDAEYHPPRNREFPELEVEVDFDVDGEDMTTLILNADEKAESLAQGREHYIWRINADETSAGLHGEATMYVMVPRVTREEKRRKALGES